MIQAADLQAVTFGLGNEVFAVPVTLVREILDYVVPFRIPNGPDYLIGLTDLRGQGVPTIDLRLRLGLPPAAITVTTRILMVDVTLADRTLTLGLVVDRVLDVSAFRRDQVEAAPDIGVRWRSDYIDGVVRRDDGFVVLIDVVRILSSDDAALFRRSTGSGMSYEWDHRAFAGGRPVRLPSGLSRSLANALFGAAIGTLSGGAMAADDEGRTFAGAAMPAAPDRATIAPMPVAESAEQRSYGPLRPGLGTPANTMAPGEISIEMGILDRQRDDTDGVRSDTLLVGSTTVRVGLTRSVEAMVGWTPFGHVRVRDATGIVDPGGWGRRCDDRLQGQSGASRRHRPVRGGAAVRGAARGTPAGGRGRLGRGHRRARQLRRVEDGQHRRHRRDRCRYQQRGERPAPQLQRCRWGERGGNPGGQDDGRTVASARR